MIKNIFKVVLISACMVTLSSTVAFGAEDNGQSTSSEAVQNVDNKLYDKQVEIDKLLFDEHAKDIESMGFKVVSTFPTDGLIEIGITPYSQTNADYIYQLLGSDLIKVVEGDQAVAKGSEAVSTLATDTGTAGNDSSQNVAPDANADTDASKAADSGLAVTSADPEAADAGVANDPKAEMATTAVGAGDGRMYKGAEAPKDTENSSMFPIIAGCIVGGIVLIGGTAVWYKKRSVINH